MANGYYLNGKPLITLPFADDFNLITRDVRKHKKLIEELHNLTRSMGLKLKPQKCRSISIRAGRSVALPFFLGNDEISSILGDRYHKFLGFFYTFDFSAISVANVIRDKIIE